MEKAYALRFLTMKLLLVAAIIVFSSSSVFSQYCLPTYMNACTSGDFIEDFSLSTIVNAGTGCSNPGPSNYSDYTGNASLTTTLSLAQTYSVSVAPGSNWGQYFVLWIDFNQDGDFDEVDEFFDVGYALAGTTITNSITMPSTGPLNGQTRLRLMCHFGTAPILQPDACSAQTWGEVEDYLITIAPPPLNEAGIIDISSPSVGCNLGLEDVTISYVNIGTDPIDTLQVCYNSNGGVAVCENLTGLGVASGDTAVHVFTTPLDLSVPGDYLINAWITLNGDLLSLNDTINNYSVVSVPTVSSIPYSEDFENGTGGWSASGAFSTWEYGIPAGNLVFSETGLCNRNNGWATSLVFNYHPAEISFLQSPCFDFSSLTSDPIFLFDHIFNFPNNVDFFSVELSIDGGSTWNTLGALGSGGNWFNIVDGWTGNSLEWRTAFHELTGTAGEGNVSIRIAISSTVGFSAEGVAIDNILIDYSYADAYAVQVTGPASNCGLGMEVVSADFYNNSTDTLFSLPVCYGVDGTVVCETINDTIAPNNTYSYDFTGLLDLSTAGNYEIVAWTNLPGDGNICNDTSSALNVSSIPFVSTYPYQETFESGRGGWGIDNSINGTWDFGTPAKNVIVGAGSGVNAFVTGGIGVGNYNNNESSFVYGPCFDFTNLPADSWMSLRIWWNSEFSWDGANLQVTTDSGATWTNLGAFGDPYNWYNDNTIGGNPGGLPEGWTGRFGSGSDGWVWAKHPIDSALYGQASAQIRIAFGSDASVNDEGFAFDDFAISTPPSIDLGMDYSGCGITVAPGLPGTYEWFTADTSGGPAILAGDEPSFDLTNPLTIDTTYSVIVVYTNSYGLCGRDTMIATVSPTPFAELGQDTVTCYGEDVWFNAIPGISNSYAWNNGAVIDSAVYNTPGTVIVTVTNNVTGCDYTDSTHIVSTLPISLGADLMICDGDSIVLDAGIGYDTLVWSGGEMTQLLTVNTAGQYIVNGIDAIGCLSSDTIDITVNPLPVVAITGAQDTICELTSIVLDAGMGFASYAWSTSGTGATETVSGSTLAMGNNTVAVTVTDAMGCSNVATVSIFVDPCVGVYSPIEDALISYFPNPTSGEVTVEISNTNSETVVLDVVNIEGRILETHLLETNNGRINTRLNLSTYSSGVYFLNVRTDNGLIHGRIIKD